MSFLEPNLFDLGLGENPHAWRLADSQHSVDHYQKRSGRLHLSKGSLGGIVLGDVVTDGYDVEVTGMHVGVALRQAGTISCRLGSPVHEAAVTGSEELRAQKSIMKECSRPWGANHEYKRVKYAAT